MRCSALSKKARHLRRRLVARLGQRHLHRQHVARIEAGVDVAQREQAAQHHAGAHQQHDRQRDLADDQQPARADADRAVAAAAFLQRVVEIGAAGAERRQRAGENAGQRSTRRATNSRTRAVDRDLVGARHLVGEQRRAGAQAARARAAGRRRRRRPRAPALRPAAAGRRGARPAPSAERIAISLRRPSARANSRLPTLAQAISSTSATAASSITSDVRMSPTISSCSGTTVAPQPAFALRILALEPRRDRVHLRLRLRERRRRASAARSTCVVVVVADGALARPCRRAAPRCRAP